MGDTEEHRPQPPRFDAESSGTPQLRASDSDREAIADALRAHCAAGRLRVDELEERLAAAFSASAIPALEHLVSDLPDKRPTPVAAHQPATGRIRPGLPGRRSFRQVHELRTGRERAFRQALQDIVPAMVADGYDVIGRFDNELLVFERRDERVVVSFNASETGRARLVVQGIARRPVRKAFANLATD